MNTNTIQLTPILGNDSLSNSRIVINDNFKILANALQNYQEYFDENGVYSSTIIAKDGTIELKANENLSIMTVSENGVEVNGGITTDDESVFTDIKVKNIRPNNIDPITIIGNVKIDGNLEVTGSVPGGGDSAVVKCISLDQFNASISAGYAVTYDKGCYVTPARSEFAILAAQLVTCIRRSNPEEIVQYINRPFTIFGKGIMIKFDDAELRHRLVTNGVIHNGPDGQYIMCAGLANFDQAKSTITSAKIFPLILRNDIFLKVEFTKTIL